MAIDQGAARGEIEFSVSNGETAEQVDVALSLPAGTVHGGGSVRVQLRGTIGVRRDPAIRELQQILIQAAIAELTRWDRMLEELKERDG